MISTWHWSNGEGLQELKMQDSQGKGRWVENRTEQSPKHPPHSPWSSLERVEIGKCVVWKSEKSFRTPSSHSSEGKVGYLVMKVNQLKGNFVLQFFFNFLVVRSSWVPSSLGESTHLSQSLKKWVWYKRHKTNDSQAFWKKNRGCKFSSQFRAQSLLQWLHHEHEVDTRSTTITAIWSTAAKGDTFIGETISMDKVD